MFQVLGNGVARYWPAVLLTWALVLGGLLAVAPRWDDVVIDGEFAFLPEDAPSRQGEKLFREAFPNDLLASSVVVVVRRETSSEGLTEADRRFVTTVLKPALLRIAEEEGGLAAGASEDSADEVEPGSAPAGSPQPAGGTSIIARVRTFEDGPVGELLDSADGKATLVIVELTTEFQERRNRPTIAKIEALIGRHGPLRTSADFPKGLDLAISGSATVGRDMRSASEQSADATELWTVILVMVLLVLIYRAPVMSVIPLATVASSVTISLSILALLAQSRLVELFAGIEIYATVLTYGAGVDYCLFLIARYREELDAGESYRGAVAAALGKVGAALTASAGTVMCGIGMMVFAEFGKFRQAGVAITLSLFVCLCAALTLTPALLRLFGRWAFWPYVPQEYIARKQGWVSATSFVADLMNRLEFRSIWAWAGRALSARPGMIWLASVAVMLPFAVVGVSLYRYLTYGLLDELPRTDPSVVGAAAVQAHFPAGATGIVTLMIQNPEIDFSKRTQGTLSIQELTERLNQRKDELKLASVRSVSHPLGTEDSIFSSGTALHQASAFNRSRAFYVSRAAPHTGHVTRIDLVFRDDPFSRDSIAQFQQLKRTLPEMLPQELLPVVPEAQRQTGVLGPLLSLFAPAEAVEETVPPAGTRLLYKGPTASMLDLKITTDGDQIRIDILVLAGVYLILVVLLRRPAVCAYLIVSVFFSYLVTLGMTIAVFWALDPVGFAGLDWKVPMFLFTILIAVGEDYNIFLMTRIEEEQARHGAVRGVIVALERTGKIISSCGFIMAGTFSSLLAGSLVGMHQLGFALAFGVLLDTFVVRPILVPAYLILLHSGRFGVVGRLLGAGKVTLAADRPQPVETAAKV